MYSNKKVKIGYVEKITFLYNFQNEKKLQQKL